MRRIMFAAAVLAALSCGSSPQMMMDIPVKNQPLAGKGVGADRFLFRKLVTRRSDRHELIFTQSLSLNATYIDRQ